MAFKVRVIHWHKGRKRTRVVEQTHVEWTDEDREIIEELRWKFKPLTYVLHLND